MGDKKRPSSSMEETPNGSIEKATDSTTSYSKISEKLKQMENRKARKTLDKEKRHLASEGKQQADSKSESTTAGQKAESESKQVRQESKAAGTTSLAQLGLHLDLFSGLSSQEISVREEAVEQLVKELRDVQRSYEESNGDNEEAGNLVGLEAKKGGGMENCAPSLRYAIRRFIRGVSSSREVRKIYV